MFNILTKSKEISKAFLADTFFRHVMYLFSGSAIFQAIQFMAMPLMTRLYTPSEMGIFGIFVSYSSIISVMSRGRYEHALMLPRYRFNTLKLMKVAFLILIISTGVILCLGHVLLLLNIIKWPYFNRSWVVFLALGVFLEGLSETCQQYLSYKERYDIFQRQRIIQASVMVLSTVYLGYIQFSFNGLICGYLLGFLSGIIYMLYELSYSRTDLAYFVNVPLKKLRSLAYSYRHFPIFTGINDFVNMAATQLPFIIYPIFFSLDQVGYFLLAQRMCLAPLGLIGRSIGQVFYQQASRHNNNSNDLVKALFNRTYRTLVRIGILPLIVLLTCAPFLFPFFFGQEWQASGIIAQLLAVSFYFSFIYSPLTFLVLVKKYQKQYLLFEVGGFVVRVVSIYVLSTWLSSFFLTCFLYSIVNAGIFLIGYVILNQLSKDKLKGMADVSV